MRLIYMVAGLLFAAAAAHGGQLYKWVDAAGNVHYSDQLPPKDARNAERKRLGDKPPEAGVPYALQEAQRKFPVTLYTSTDCGEACKAASAYLSKRGIPHDVKDAREPTQGAELLKLTGGKLEVPVLTVGPDALRGFEAGAWGRALDVAGYPSSSVMPKDAKLARQVEGKAPAAAPKAAPGEAATSGEGATN